MAGVEYASVSLVVAFLIGRVYPTMTAIAFVSLSLVVTSIVNRLIRPLTMCARAVERTRVAVRLAELTWTSSR
jgi:hypothetical protein